MAMFKVCAHSVSAFSVRPKKSVAFQAVCVPLFRFKRLFDRDSLPRSETLNPCFKDLGLVRNALQRTGHGLTDSSEVAF